MHKEMEQQINVSLPLSLPLPFPFSKTNFKIRTLYSVNTGHKNKGVLPSGRARTSRVSPCSLTAQMWPGGRGLGTVARWSLPAHQFLLPVSVSKILPIRDLRSWRCTAGLAGVPTDSSVWDRSCISSVPDSRLPAHVHSLY